MDGLTDGLMYVCIDVWAGCMDGLRVWLYW